MDLKDKLEQEMMQASARHLAVLTYPDLKEVEDRWGIIRLTTSFVNAEALNFEVMHECDCCSNVTTYALPYIEFEGIRLYSNPPAVSFAKKIMLKGAKFYMADDEWDESKEWLEFNEKLLDKIAIWLDEHDIDPEEFDDDDNEEADYNEIEEMENDPGNIPEQPQ